MAKIAEILGGRAISTIELRWLRTVLDTLAVCENLSLTAVSIDSTSGEISRHFSSYQNPFIEMCRKIKKFIEIEDKIISTAAQAGAKSIGEVSLTKSYEILGKKFQGAMVRTSLDGLIIFAGPVATRTSNAGEPLRNELAVNEVIENLERLAEENEVNSEIIDSNDYISKTRASRLIRQRSPITLNDLSHRLTKISTAFESIFQSNVSIGQTSADSIEAFTKAVSFSVTRRPVKKSSYKALSPTAYQTKFHELGNYVPCVRTDWSGNVFVETVDASVQKVSEWASAEIRLWSLFCDNYRTTRNSYHLERLLVIRLWAQDTFSGTTIQTEKGTEREPEFAELAERILDLCAADGCVIYRFHPGETPERSQGSRRGYLQTLGQKYAYPELEDQHGIESKHMEAISSDKEIRDRSICYRCVDSGKTQFLSSAGVQDIESAARSPKSVLVAPLISRGRIWGAVEVFGVLPGQLHHDSPRWVEEIVRVVTPIFYNQWMLFHFREMSKTVVSTGSSESKYRLALDHVRMLFLASSARLYVQHPTRTSEFYRKAHAGVDFPEDCVERFSLYNKDSISARCIEEGQAWESGRIGEYPFDENPPGSGCGPLELNGHKAAAVIPVRNRDENCFASIFITSLDDEEFPIDWLSIARTVSLQLSVILEAIHLKDTKVVEDQAYFAHTIKTRSERVQAGGQKLLGQLKPLFGDAEIYDRMPDLIEIAESAVRSRQRLSRIELLHQNELWAALRAAFPRSVDGRSGRKLSIPKTMKDLESHLDELQLSAVRITGGPNDENPAETHPTTWGGTPCSIRNAILESTKPKSELPLYRRTLVMPHRSVIDWPAAVYMPEQILVEILNNLLDNAIKYDFSPPSVALRVLSGDGGSTYTIRISNLAPKVSQIEAKSIEAGSVRGQYAIERDRRGGGKGLAYSMEKAAQWGLVLKYTVPTLDGEGSGGDLGWHVLDLTMTNVASQR